MLFVAGALVSFGDSMVRLANGTMPPSAHDAEIVGASARLTIALMTTGLVWFYAARFARWLVPLALLLKLGMALVGTSTQQSTATGISPLWLAGILMGALATAMLFAPPSRPWFSVRTTKIADARA